MIDGTVIEITASILLLWGFLNLGYWVLEDRFIVDVLLITFIMTLMALGFIFGVLCI